MPMYDIPAKTHRFEETIRRSKFIATIAHAEKKEEAAAFISRIKKEFPDASHHCWAHVAGPPGDTARIGMSDDGEPHGTAGKPILSVILHSGIGEIVAVVTRYFGGTKLGTGGLVRAYSGAVKNALSGLPTRVKRDTICQKIILDYSKLTAAKRLVRSCNGRVIEEKFGAEVALTIEIPKECKDRFADSVNDITSGDIHFYR